MRARNKAQVQNTTLHTADEANPGQTLGCVIGQARENIERIASQAIV